MENLTFCAVSRYLLNLNLSVIRQKGGSKNGCFKKTKHVKFSEKNPEISYLLIRTCAYQEIRNVRGFFFRKFGVLCFLETPVLRFAKQELWCFD